MFTIIYKIMREKILRFVFFTSLIVAPVLPMQQASAPALAFPGAEGFGAKSVGGRGGRIIEVTNLNDEGSGSLRAAIDATGPRIVVFRVAGTIELHRTLEVRNAYITIAGQSAPGEGITLKTHPSLIKSALKIATHDVIVRYIRLRPGPSTDESNSLDALQITNGYNIIIDHCSFSWSVDEVIDVWSNVHDVSFQWNIIAEALYMSNHVKKRDHSMAMLLGNEGTGNISVHHNLFAQNRNRIPRIKVAFGVVDVVNNVIYNPKFENEGWAPSHISDEYGKQQVNYIGNYIKLGPNSSEVGYYVSAGTPAQNGVEIYLNGNTVVDRSGTGLATMDGPTVMKNREFIVSEKHPSPAIASTSASQAFTSVLSKAGVTLPTRDAVDNRIIEDTFTGNGTWIDSPSQVGGWPKLVGGTPYRDCDHDGMADTWERLYGLNPSDGNDGAKDADNDGYTNVEEYLNSTNPNSAVEIQSNSDNSTVGSVDGSVVVQAYLPLIQNSVSSGTCPA